MSTGELSYKYLKAATDSRSALLPEVKDYDLTSRLKINLILVFALLQQLELLLFTL